MTTMATSTVSEEEVINAQYLEKLEIGDSQFLTYLLLTNHQCCQV
jgi:hypothetical protein